MRNDAYLTTAISLRDGNTCGYICIKRVYFSQRARLSSLASQLSWSTEWKDLGLGARLPKNGSNKGSGQGATKASTGAIRNAIEFNSIRGLLRPYREG